MNKKLAVLGLALMMAVSTAVSAAPIDDLNASVQKYSNPTGTYVLHMTIPFKNVDTMNTDSTIDIQASPYCARVKNVVSMGKQDPDTSWVYEEQVGNQMKTYTQETLHKGDKKKSWVYELTDIKPGETIMNAVDPKSLFAAVKTATLVGKTGNTERIKIAFDCEKLFSNWGVKHTLQESTSDTQTDADFEKEFEKLRKSGTLDGQAVITAGVLTHIDADITKPVDAFTNVIKKGVSRKTHTGFMGNWILGMILRTGKSTLNLDLKPLQGYVSIPADVKNAAVLKPETAKK